MAGFRVVYEEFKVHGKELVDKVSDLIREGNVRRIIVKDEKGNTFLEIPLTVATIGPSPRRCWPVSGRLRR